MAFMTVQELIAEGFAQVGEGALVSRLASIHGASRIHIGAHTRIDDFCVISAGREEIYIGRYVHIATHSSIIGAERIELHDFSNISSRVSIYSSSDDYSGASLTNPTIPDHYKRVDSRPVHIGRHAIVGSGSVILPGAHLGDGVAVGALSVVRGRLEPFGVYVGNPCRYLKARKRGLLELEQAFLKEAR